MRRKGAAQCEPLSDRSLALLMHEKPFPIPLGRDAARDALAYRRALRDVRGLLRSPDRHDAEEINKAAVRIDRVLSPE